MAANDSDAESTVLYLAAVLMAFFGLFFLLVPDAMFDLTQDPGVPTNPVAAWLAANNPEGQRPLVVGLATAFTLITLSLLYGWLAGDYHGVLWVSLMQILGNGSLAGAMWWLATRTTSAQ
jgi:hypothetical protein